MDHARVIRSRTPTRATTVAAVRDLTPRMRRLTLHGPDLLGVPVAPAQDTELVLTDPSGRRLKRRYTIRAARSELGEWDIDALLHGEGPGARFAATAEPGAELPVIGPRGRLELRPAAWHLLVGDESALPGIAAILEALPATEPAVVLLEVGGPDDELPITRPAGELDLRWLPRGPLEPGTPDVLGAAVQMLPARPGGHGYLLGESRVMIGLRPEMTRIGLGPDQLYLKGYWNRARHPGPRPQREPTVR